MTKQGYERGVSRYGEEWDTHMPCHPDCEIGHDPPRAVLRQDDDEGTWRPILRFQPPGDLPHFLHGAAPGPLGHLAMNRLGQERLSLQIMFKRINSLQRQLAFREPMYLEISSNSFRFIQQIHSVPTPTSLRRRPSLMAYGDVVNQVTVAQKMTLAPNWTCRELVAVESSNTALPGDS
jgi:hypothetical protein